MSKSSEEFLNATPEVNDFFKSMLKFKAENLEGEMDIVGLIAKRASFLHGVSKSNQINVEMDLVACHLVTPLDLKKLLTCEKSDFIHDLQGINANINHNTGELENFFHPRCALPRA